MKTTIKTIGAAAAVVVTMGTANAGLVTGALGGYWFGGDTHESTVTAACTTSGVVTSAILIAYQAPIIPALIVLGVDTGLGCIAGEVVANAQDLPR